MVSIGAVGGGLTEGDYTTWAFKWIHNPSYGLGLSYEASVFINEINGTITLVHEDGTGKKRLGVYNINDFSVVYESGVDYIESAPNMAYAGPSCLGMVEFDYGAYSRSKETYILIERDNRKTIEVWRGGAAALWSRNVASDHGTVLYCYTGLISYTGKYVIVGIRENYSPYLDYLMLYEGS